MKLGCCSQGVPAEADEEVDLDVRPHVARLDAGRDQSPQEVVDPCLARPVIARPVQRRGELGAVPSTTSDHPGVGAEDRSQGLLRVVGGLAHRGQLLEVRVDLALVPGREDGLDVGEVLVDRRPGDPRGGGDPGHGDGPEPVLVGERPRGVLDRLAHHAAVGLDGLVPELRHAPTVPPIALL
ncbi:hypothetical protein GCM10023203_07110 [Actinomycetospora straminea]|uniref:Uncharacterized protein n=1 Tax=Actinomycetospora straminea TaxID=663607 RepID=A0ABP9DWI5_9PSEU